MCEREREKERERREREREREREGEWGGSLTRGWSTHAIRADNARPALPARDLFRVTGGPGAASRGPFRVIGPRNRRWAPMKKHCPSRRIFSESQAGQGPPRGRRIWLFRVVFRLLERKGVAREREREREGERERERDRERE